MPPTPKNLSGDTVESLHEKEKAASVSAYRWFLLQAFVMIVAYLSVGPGLIVLNKEIMSTYDFPYPVTLSSLGQVFIATAAWLLVHTGHATISDEARESVSGVNYWRCLAVGLFKALTLSFGNIVYLHLNLGFIQMLKAFSPVLTLLLLVVTRVEGLPSPQVALSVLSIAAFTAATTALESNANPLGLFYMAMAQITEALSLVLTQFLLQKKKFTVIESQYFLAPASVLCLFICAALTGEWATMYNRQAQLIIWANPIKFFCAASLGMVVNYLTTAVIQVSSGTMLKVLATVRNVVAVIIGAVFYSEHISGSEWAMYGCTLIGFTSYTYFSMMQKKKVENDSPKGVKPQPMELATIEVPEDDMDDAMLEKQRFR